MTAFRQALCLFVFGAAALAISLGRPPAAYACSLAGMSAALLPYYLESSTIVAVGRLTDATRAEIVLEVEEGLKGTRQGERLVLNNRQLGLGAGCEVYVEPNGPGWALPEEQRVIAFLEPDLSQRPQVWMPAQHGYGIYEVHEDGKPFGASGWPSEAVVRVEEYRRAFAKYADVLFEPGLEGIRPCNPVGRDPANAAVLSRLSEAIAIATVTRVEGLVATLETEEIIRGSPGRVFTLNASQFHQANECAITPGGGPAYSVGDRMLVLLYPDEFGVAKYRPADWGAGWLTLHGEWVSNGLPVLQDVRDLLASGVGTKPPPSNASRVRDGVLYPTFFEEIPGSPIHEAPQPVAEGSVTSTERDDSGRWPDGWLLTLSAGLLFLGSLFALGTLWHQRRR